MFPQGDGEPQVMMKWCGGIAIGVSQFDEDRDKRDKKKLKGRKLHPSDSYG